MKKTVSILLTLLMLVGMLAIGTVSASAATATSLSGGTTYSSDTTITLSGDQTITGQIKITGGATVTLNMNSKTLTYTNSTPESMFFLSGGTLIITGAGTIKSANSAKPADGGFANITGSADNKLTIASGSTVNIQDFQVTGNGGAINLVDGTVLMNGGSISGCSAGQNGGGVYFGSGSLTLSGNVRIYDNMKEGAQNNLYLNDTLVTFSGLASTAKIGVYPASIPTATGETKAVKIGYSDTDCSGNVLNNRDNKSVIKYSNGMIIMKKTVMNKQASTLSEGNLWIIITVAVLAIGGVATLFIVKKKKKPIAANGASTDDE